MADLAWNVDRHLVSLKFAATLRWESARSECQKFQITLEFIAKRFQRCCPTNWWYPNVHIGRYDGMLFVMDDLVDLSTLSGLPPEAFADAVFNRYAERLMRVARERLSTKLQSKVSPEDVVQSAFKSFFRRQHEFEFKNDDSDGLWGLLVVMTIRKCAKWVDVFGTDKRSVDREASLNAETASGHRWHEAVGRDPGPEEAAMMSELIERLMKRLDTRQQQMLSLRMQGFELEEIAEQVQSSRRTVARVIAEMKNVLRELLIEGV